MDALRGVEMAECGQKNGSGLLTLVISSDMVMPTRSLYSLAHSLQLNRVKEVNGVKEVKEVNVNKSEQTE
jgi:hypothetical protein